jgi:hypothetical protein
VISDVSHRIQSNFEKADKIRSAIGENSMSEQQEIREMKRSSAPENFDEEIDQFLCSSSQKDDGSRGRNDAVLGAIESGESKIGLALQPSIALLRSRNGLGHSFSDEEQLRQKMQDGEIYQRLLEVADYTANGQKVEAHSPRTTPHGSTISMSGRIAQPLSSYAPVTSLNMQEQEARMVYLPFVQETRETVRFSQREPSLALSPQYPYRQVDPFGMGSMHEGTELSTRQGRQDLDNVTSRDSKRPKERARDREYKQRFSVGSTTGILGFGSPLPFEPPPPVGGHRWPRDEGSSHEVPRQNFVNRDMDQRGQYQMAFPPPGPPGPPTQQNRGNLPPSGLGTPFTDRITHCI